MSRLCGSFPGQNTPHLTLSSCLLFRRKLSPPRTSPRVPKNKLNQRREQRQKQRETVNGDQMQIAYPLNRAKDLQFLLKGWR